ncbi:MAG: divergent polysaccharide deacetylase family protein [Candidatus Omnitrophica bacterium]|nr:divergent polysaccharide deacetylase family protein [Candidatus Omnitrophota bacterium]
MRKKSSQILIIVLCSIVAIQAVFIVVLLKKERKPVVKIKKAKVAIVLDDWGYNLKHINFIKESKLPMTISILPFLPYSKQISEEAEGNNLEVIVHLPLEPHNWRKVNVEKKVILGSMKKDEILKILSDSFKSVLHAKGISNHMGSKATEDKDLMSVIFGELKKKRLYFLDSFVTPKTVCEDLAADMNVAFAQRTIFLDNEADSEYIHGQLMSLLDHASRHGEAIGIGHDRDMTLKVIKEFLPKINKEKYEVVFVSDLVNR